VQPTPIVAAPDRGNDLASGEDFAARMPPFLPKQGRVDHGPLKISYEDRLCSQLTADLR